MAPIGTVIKNGLIFVILTAGITYAAAQLLAAGIVHLMISVGLKFDSSSENYDEGITFLWLGLLTLVGGSGLVYMKSLSDTVEEGMIEF